MDVYIRRLEADDFYRGYLELLQMLSRYTYPSNYKKFSKFIQDTKNTHKTFVLIDPSDDKVIGASTLIIIPKIHANPIAQIEDVIIHPSYRGHSYGKKLIQEIITYIQTNTICYKIILNTTKNNLGFYEKCGFVSSGIEYRYSQ